MEKIIIWDFDGTLGYREGNWEGAIFELIEDENLKTKKNFEIVSGILKRGFPWHSPLRNYSFLSTSSAWWEYVNPIFAEIFITLGMEKKAAAEKAKMVGRQYIQNKKWKIYEDTLPNLGFLQHAKWKQVLATNNVPEFPVILEKLGLKNYFEEVFISSLVGYNKPNPLIIHEYLEKCSKGSKIFVIGDRADSDLVFAESIHAEGILVRAVEGQGKLRFNNLHEVAGYLYSLNL